MTKRTASCFLSFSSFFFCSFHRSSIVPSFWVFCRSFSVRSIVPLFVPKMNLSDKSQKLDLFLNSKNVRNKLGPQNIITQRNEWPKIYCGRRHHRHFVWMQLSKSHSTKLLMLTNLCTVVETPDITTEYLTEEQEWMRVRTIL